MVVFCCVFQPLVFGGRLCLHYVTFFLGAWASRVKIQSQVQLKTWLIIDTPEQSEVLYGSFDLYEPFVGMIHTYDLLHFLIFEWAPNIWTQERHIHLAKKSLLVSNRPIEFRVIWPGLADGLLMEFSMAHDIMIVDGKAPFHCSQ